MFSEPSPVLDPSAPDPATSVVEEDKIVAEKPDDLLEHEKQLVYDREVVVESQLHSNGNDVSIVIESPSSGAQDNAPKKSYASIVSL